MSIRARLLLLILFATLIPAVLGGIRFLERRELQIAEVKRDITVSAGQVAQSLTNTVRSTAQLHYGLSRARDFDSPNREACSEFLAQVLKEHPQYTGILTINPDGQLHCDSLRTGRTLDLNDRHYFQTVTAANQPLAVEPAFGRLTGQAVLQIAYGVRDELNRVKFVLLASLNLEKFMQARSLALPHPDAVIALIDSKGMVLTWHPGDGKMRGTTISSPALLQVLRDSGESVQEDMETDGVTRIWAVSRMPDIEETGLRVLVGVSKQELLAAADQTLYLSLTALAAIWLLVFAGAWALAEFAIRRQLKRISSAVVQFGKGEINARIGHPYPRGEIGELMVALDQAFDLLKSQREVIQELNRDLERRVAERTTELERANRELEAFSYSVSHDLRAPVRHIHGFARMAVDHIRPADTGTLSYLQKITHAAERMSMLIEALLKLSRLGRAEMVSRRVELAGVIKDAQEECLRDAGGRSIAWSIGDLPAVEGDAGLLHQVFVNLLGNAIKFSSGVEHPSIAVQAEPAGEGMVQISVRDNGAGFDMKYAGKLFGVFERLHTQQDFAGTGIGLATVKRIVERHGGRVWGASGTGAGAVFFVTLKLA